LSPFRLVLHIILRKNNREMDKQVRIIGIELEELERIITKIVTEQNRILSEELKALMDKKDDPLNSDHITIKDLMVQLGVTRNTIQNYRKSGLLPPPNFDLSGHPYWTAEQLVTFMNTQKAKGKFPS
jgi:hypothetical protein